MLLDRPPVRVGRGRGALALSHAVWSDQNDEIGNLIPKCECKRVKSWSDNDQSTRVIESEVLDLR